MSDTGVIPPHGPREVGRTEDIDGVPIVFGINLDGTVRVSIRVFGSSEEYDRWAEADLDHDAREQFMRLWCEAERQAEASDG